MKAPVLPGLFMLQIQEMTPPRFDGATYSADKDQARLGAQLQRVLGVLKRGEWVTLAEIAAMTGDPEASISARVRDCRKMRFGGFEIRHRRRTDAQWEYQLRKDV